MEKINFIGAFDKTDLIMYVAKILVEMGKKVLIVDATVEQKARYVIPAIDNSLISYVTNYLDIDIAVGFSNYNEIKQFLGMPESAVFTYDYIFIDINNPNLVNSFEIYDARENYFVTSADLYSLKKGLETLRKIEMPLKIAKIYFSNQMSKAEDDYLNFLSLGYRIQWQDDKIYFPMQSQDQDIIMENQRLSRIKFRGISSEYKDALIYLAQEISNDQNGVKKHISKSKKESNMAVVSFWGNSRREIGQTLSVVAIGTMMAIEHNYKILVISTGFRDRTMEKCFWERNKNGGINLATEQGKQIGLNNGIEGLIKIIQSNRTSSNIIRDYAKVVFKDRLDILLSPTTTDPREYNTISPFYKDIIKLADKEYDLVLVDIDKRMEANDKNAILQESNLVMVTLKQSVESIETARILREKNPASRNNNIMFLSGKYDFDSKYNTKNLTRFLKEPREISAIPYNKLYDEAAMEGKVADFFLKYRGFTDQTDRNVRLIEEAKRTCDNIIYKLQELNIRT